MGFGPPESGAKPACQLQFYVTCNINTLVTNGCFEAQGPESASTRRWKAWTRALLHELFEVDLMQVPSIRLGTALTLLSEVGTEFSLWKQAFGGASD